MGAAGFRGDRAGPGRRRFGGFNPALFHSAHREHRGYTDFKNSLRHSISRFSLNEGPIFARFLLLLIGKDTGLSPAKLENFLFAGRNGLKKPRYCFIR